MTEALSLRRYRLFGLRLDLADRVDHGIEGQHRRGMPGLVIAHRLEQRDIGPLALRPAGRFLLHLVDRLPRITQLAPRPGHDLFVPDPRRGPAAHASPY